MNETVKIGPRVPEEVWENFKLYAEKKRGKKGGTGDELTQAMINHMAEEEDDPNLELQEKIERMDTRIDYMMTSIRNIESQFEENSGGGGGV